MKSSPTRVTQNAQSLIDIMACSHANNITKTAVYSISISDHDLIGLSRKVNCKRFCPRKIMTRNYKNYNKEHFKSELKCILDRIILSYDLNSAWNTCKNALIQCVNKHVPLKKRSVSGRDCPWLTPDVRNRIKERDYYLSRARKQGTETN